MVLRNNMWETMALNYRVLKKCTANFNELEAVI